MQGQGKHHKAGAKSVIQERKKLKAIVSPSMPQEQGQGNAVTHGAKSLAKYVKGSRVIYSSDAERKLDGVHYRLGDMVWAKVKSHPWWPGQLFDPALASASAMELKRDSCFLVAFFGDSTFGWFAETELIPYEPNFPQKSRQTSAPNFVDAVEDSLDEVRKRVKSGLACHCSAAEDALDTVEKRDGLLYDRQLYDIRRGFAPPTLLSAIKQLACSPFSFSQNSLRNTVAGAQTDAFRRLVSCKRPLEHKDSQGLLQKNCSVEYDHNVVEILKNRTLSAKPIPKEHRPKMPSSSKSLGEEEGSPRIQCFEEKLGTMNELGKIKKLAKNSISKKRRTEKNKDRHRDNQATEGTVFETNNAQSGEHGASVSNEGLTNEAFGKEKGVHESEHCSEKSDARLSTVLSDRGIHSLVDDDVLAVSHDTDHKAANCISDAVAAGEHFELVAITNESNAEIKRAKIVKMERDHGSKLNATKKMAREQGSKLNATKKLAREQGSKLNATKMVLVADINSSHAREKAEVVTTAKNKRFMEIEPVDSCREVKKRILLPVGNDTASDKLSDFPNGTTAICEAPQQPDKVTCSPTCLESNLNHLHEKHRANSSPEIPEMVFSTEQLCNEEAEQCKHVDDDATGAHDTGSEFVVPNNGSEGDHKATPGLQAEMSLCMGGKTEENLKDLELERRDLTAFPEETVPDTSKKRRRTEDVSNCDSAMEGEGEEDVLETQLKGIKDQTLKDPNVSPSRDDSTVPRFDGSCAVEKMQDGVQTNIENSRVKYGQESKRLPRDDMESKQLPLSNTTMSNKRALDENPSKGSKTKNKKMRIVALEKTASKLHAGFGAAGEKYAGLYRGDLEATRLQNLLEGLISVATKPLDVVNDEWFSAVFRVFMNFRKVVYKKGVLRTDAGNSVTSSPVAVPQVKSEVENANNGTALLRTEKIEGKAFVVGDDPIRAEPSIVEDSIIRGRGDDLVNQKQSEEGSTSQAIPSKRPIPVSKTPSTSSISLRPAFETVIPVCGSKEVLNRFGQRVPRAVDAGEKISPLLFKSRSSSEERDLVISFPYGYVLPSEKQLKDMFIKYGELNEAGTRVDSKIGCAHIIFKHAKNAETALTSMKEKCVFENAHFSLKPRDANMKELAKHACRNVAFSNKHVVSSNSSSAESKIVAGKGRGSCSSVKGLLVHPNNNVLVADRTAVSENTALQIIQGGGVEPVLQSAPGVTFAPTLPMIGSDLLKASTGSQRKLDETHSGVVAPSSVILKAGPRSLASPITADISEPFLALLHQLHDLVLSTGFVM